jgi:hypothetical protein
MLKARKIDDIRGSVAKVENARVLGYTNDFERLEVWHHAEANTPADGAPIREQAFYKTAANDSDMRVPLVIVPIKVAAAKQPNSERLEKTRRDHRRVRHDIGSRA